MPVWAAVLLALALAGGAFLAWTYLGQSAKQAGSLAGVAKTAQRSSNSAGTTGRTARDSPPMDDILSTLTPEGGLA